MAGVVVGVFSANATEGLLAYPAAIVVALGFLLFARGKRKRPRVRTVLAHMFHEKIWLHKSTLLDFQYIILGALAFSGMIAYLTFGQEVVSSGVYHLLTRWFGPGAANTGNVFLTGLAILLLFLSYEFGFWFDHFLSHKIPFLWEFHKVHHSAKVITPLTNARVHPVDTIVFYNILAVTVGIAYGFIAYGFGKEISYASIAAQSALFMGYMMLYGHLQHSQLWIPVTGWAGKILHSPAHHQIHHSTDERHFDKNFGRALCVFDWCFGTLHVPSKKREKLTFGVDDDAHLQHILPSLAYPFWYSARHAVPKAAKKQQSGGAESPH